MGSAAHLVSLGDRNPRQDGAPHWARRVGAPRPDQCRRSVPNHELVRRRERRRAVRWSDRKRLRLRRVLCLWDRLRGLLRRGVRLQRVRQRCRRGQLRRLHGHVRDRPRPWRTVRGLLRLRVRVLWRGARSRAGSSSRSGAGRHRFPALPARGGDGRDRGRVPGSGSRRRRAVRRAGWHRVGLRVPVPCGQRLLLAVRRGNHREPDGRVHVHNRWAGAHVPALPAGGGDDRDRGGVHRCCCDRRRAVRLCSRHGVGLRLPVPRRQHLLLDAR